MSYKLKETPQETALRALKQLTKSSLSALQLDSVPPEILFGTHLNYEKWSMILTDKNLQTLSEQEYSGRKFPLDPSSPNLFGMLKNFYSPLNVFDGIISLNLSGSKQISDYGISLIARKSPNLRDLNISGCTKITDTGVREVGINCNRLINLNISSCHEIIGKGLISIAECCRLLLKLDVSKCKNIKNWSLTKVFYECQNLEEVNVSYLKDISDEEIRVLSQNCPHIIMFNALECHCITDNSILSLSQHCKDIDYIDVSRSQMAYRITDVTLMALSKHSFSIKSLKLNGCDHITDVGLTWLSEGCKSLEILELSRCNKVSDAGLRAIGSACHSLKKIDIAYAKQVTDIGVSSLSKGCPELHTVNCQGVFLLADPRLSIPKKGAKLEAWQTAIGVAALSNNCPNIETLDLSGCFRLNISFHEYVSSLKHLRNLTITGCNQTVTSSLEAVARGCLLLESINLSDCGKAVNDKSMKAFAKYCKFLKTVILCRCDLVKGGAIRALSYCQNLEKLDLTSCSNLTDSSLVYISEIDKVPKLRTLILNDIPKLTDSILAWISIKPQDILLFAFKGTSITKKAATSVRDRFPNSDLLENDNFFGFWPKQRVDDRILINKYYKMIDGIVRIQARHRAYKGKLRVANIFDERRRIAAQYLLQRVIRGFLAKVRVFHIRKGIIEREKAAVKITSMFWIARAKKRVARMKVFLLEKTRIEKASMIQLAWRMHRDRGILALLKYKKQLFIERKISCAIKIQSIARMLFAHNRIKKIKDMKKGRELLINRKAIVIQRSYRGYAARKIMNEYRRMILDLSRKRKHATLLIQKNFRVYRTNKIVKYRQDKKNYYSRCIVKIQALIRGSLSRIHTAELRTELHEKLRLKAAIRIQTRLRIVKAKLEFQRRLLERSKQINSFEAAANIIISNSRIKLARNILSRKRSERYERLKFEAQKELDAVTKIQALFRGIKGREKFAQAIRDKKAKWKELFDEDKQKRFFYNKLTGEIRWRMPQDLLDLIPHPKCDNCCDFDATVECSDCNELYCNVCWNQIHSGGRRRDHEFRALYDYYGKRLDYGDGEYPSKWPSDIIQDEIQGWMLRVAPYRKPSNTYASGWEEYYEQLPDGSNHTFYFNRQTFDSSYEAPVDLQQENAQYQYYDDNYNGVYSSGYYDESGNWVSNVDGTMNFDNTWGTESLGRSNDSFQPLNFNREIHSSDSIFSDSQNASEFSQTYYY